VVERPAGENVERETAHACLGQGAYRHYAVPLTYPEKKVKSLKQQSEEGVKKKNLLPRKLVLLAIALR